MHSYATVFTFILYFLALSLMESSALKCYSCVQCNDPFKSEEGSQVDCNGSCQKLKVKGLVTRLCLPLLKSDDCEVEDDNAACQCTTDLCNSAFKTKMPVLVILTFASAIVLRNYVF